VQGWRGCGGGPRPPIALSSVGPGIYVPWGAAEPIDEGLNVIAKSNMPDLLEREARKRWGAAVEFCVASTNSRYVGSVYSWRSCLLQRVNRERVVVHRAMDIEFRGEALCKALRVDRLEGQVLSIYYVAGKGIAYCRTRKASSLGMSNLKTQTNRGQQKSGVVISVAAAVAAALALAACASKNKLITPNGKERVAINTSASLAKYQDIVTRQDEMTLEKSDLQRKVELLSAQVATLKAYVVEHERKDKARENVPALPSTEQPKPNPTPPPATPTKNDGKNAAEAMIVGPDRITFRISHDVGRTAFAPTAVLEGELLKAAAAAKSISIRGRTDATVADEVETSIALARAVHARQFLVANGVDAAKIKTWYRAAGGFVVDNSSPEGRAVNRRVEIETRGLDTSVYAPLISDIQLGKN
jgi:outer membrane protein OmpA-like peptidoglycan-associated protein